MIADSCFYLLKIIRFFIREIYIKKPSVDILDEECYNLLCK